MQQEKGLNKENTQKNLIVQEHQNGGHNVKMLTIF